MLIAQQSSPSSSSLLRHKATVWAARLHWSCDQHTQQSKESPMYRLYVLFYRRLRLAGRSRLSRSHHCTIRRLALCFSPRRVPFFLRLFFCFALGVGSLLVLWELPHPPSLFDLPSTVANPEGAVGGLRPGDSSPPQASRLDEIQLFRSGAARNWTLFHHSMDSRERRSVSSGVAIACDWAHSFCAEGHKHVLVLLWPIARRLR